MLDKPALLKWANKIGLEGIKLDDYRSKSKQSGTSLHEQIEQYLKFKILPDDKELSNRIVMFFSDKEIISVEESFECEYYTGRFDVKLRWKDFVFICDFKSNSGVYFETKLQLAAYKMVCECDHVAVIHLPELLIRPVSIYPEYYKFITCLSELYTLKQKIEQSK